MKKNSACIWYECLYVFTRFTRLNFPRALLCLRERETSGFLLRVSGCLAPALLTQFATDVDLPLPALLELLVVYANSWRRAASHDDARRTTY